MVRLLAGKVAGKQKVHQEFGYRNGGKHTKHNAKAQRYGKASDWAGAEVEQNYSRNKSCDVGVENGYKRTGEAFIHCGAQGFTRCNFFFKMLILL